MSTKKSFYIPSGMTVDGTFTVDVPGQIAGTVNGDVVVNGKLIILKNAVVNGDVKAGEIELLGKVTGDIHCMGKMILQNASIVKGNIITVEIHIEKDAVVDGVITKPGMHHMPEEPVPETEEELTIIEEPEEPVIAVAEPVTKEEDQEAQSWF